MAAVTAALGGSGGAAPALGGAPGGGPGSDTTAIHDNVASEISAITNKATVADGDFILIEDSADSNAKKHILASLVKGGAVTITERAYPTLANEGSGAVDTSLEYVSHELTDASNQQDFWSIPIPDYWDSLTGVFALIHWGGAGTATLTLHTDFGAVGESVIANQEGPADEAVGSVSTNIQNEVGLTAVGATWAPGDVIGLRIINKSGSPGTVCRVYGVFAEGTYSAS